MIKVALTGGIASGKSTVAQFFREAGMAVVDADETARQVAEPGGPAYDALRRMFGADFFQGEDGPLDRQKLSEYVFSHPEALARLNEAIHPWIGKAVRARLRELQAGGAPLVIVEVPLLFELGLEDQYDRVIVVYVDRQTQRRRLGGRDRRRAVEIEGILAAQMPMAEKRARADYVIDNRGSKATTAKQVENIVAQLENILDKKT